MYHAAIVWPHACVPVCQLFGVTASITAMQTVLMCWACGGAQHFPLLHTHPVENLPFPFHKLMEPLGRIESLL